MTTFRGVLAVACLAGVLPTQLTAQGAFIDWINKMSGPELRTYGVTVRFPGNEPGRMLNFGYNPGQRITADEVTILRHGFLSMQVLALDSLRDCFARAHEVLAGPDAVFHEATIDSVRREIHTIGRALVQTGGTGVTTAPVRDLLGTACRIADPARTPLVRDPGWGLRLRGGLSFGHDRQNVDRPETSIYAISPQLTAELIGGFGQQRPVYLGFETGVAAWYWVGDFRPFVSYSFPLIVNYHPFARCSSWLLRNFRIGGGVHVFTDIDEDKFGAAVFPEEVGGEVVPTFFVSLDISASSRDAPRLGCGP
jgi:hypothetical protein